METPQSLTDIPHEEVHSELHFNPSRHVCVAIDDSEHSGTSLEWAMENILNAEKDQIILLHCRPYSIFPSPPLGLSGDVLPQLDDSRRKASHELLKHFAIKLKGHGYHVRAIALVGDPRQEIVHKAKEVKADMVIVGSRGSGRFKTGRLGSVSDYLVHHLEVPVIVTRNKE